MQSIDLTLLLLLGALVIAFIVVYLLALLLIEWLAARRALKNRRQMQEQLSGYRERARQEQCRDRAYRRATHLDWHQQPTSAPPVDLDVGDPIGAFFEARPSGFNVDFAGDRSEPSGYSGGSSDSAGSSGSYGSD